MNKKAVELSLNTIIVAIIVLVVLVVIIVIFTTQTGKTAETLKGFNDCSSRGGTCVTQQQGCATGSVGFFKYGCTDTAPLCCIPEK